MAERRRIAVVWVDDGTGENVAMEVDDTFVVVGESVVEKTWQRVRQQRQLLMRSSDASSRGWHMTILNPDRVVGIQEAQE